VTDNATPSEREVIATIREFLSERREWELRTMERVTGWQRGDAVDPDRPVDMDFEELDRAWADLAVLRSAWCTATAAARLDANASFGTSPEFNPEGISIVELARVSDVEVLVRTRELPNAESEAVPTEYEYRLRLVGKHWRLDQRSMVEPGWGRIDDLLQDSIVQARLTSVSPVIPSRTWIR
jgi:hypothetical protein